MAAPTLDISEARKHLNSIDERLKDDRVIYVTRHNKRAFAVVNLDFLSAVMSTIDILADSESMALIEKGIADIREGRFRNHDDVEKELG